jgi:hypothetical protein
VIRNRSKFVPAERGGQGRPLKLSIVTGFAAAIAVALHIVMQDLPIRHIRVRMDAVTGSVESETSWPLGFTSGPVIHPSTLETRARQIGILWRRDWRTTQEADYAFLGVPPLTRGAEPPIGEMALLDQLFLDHCSDVDFREFIRTLESATDEQRRRAIDAAERKALCVIETQRADFAAGSSPRK